MDIFARLKLANKPSHSKAARYQRIGEHDYSPSPCPLPDPHPASPTKLGEEKRKEAINPIISMTTHLNNRKMRKTWTR
jgi:hypothetical protein